MINTTINEIPSFLEGRPDEMDKLIWKKAYATFIIESKKSPEGVPITPLKSSDFRLWFDRQWTRSEQPERP